LLILHGFPCRTSPQEDSNYGKHFLRTQKMTDTAVRAKNRLLGKSQPVLPLEEREMQERSNREAALNESGRNFSWQRTSRSSRRRRSKS
jgi:hypothetical protein